jgi:hypothetical protein
MGLGLLIDHETGQKRVKLEIRTETVRVVGSSLLAAERAAWLTTFLVLAGSRALGFGAAQGWGRLISQKTKGFVAFAAYC